MVGRYGLGNSFAPTKRVNERQCCALRPAPVVGIHRWAIHPHGTKIRHLDHHAQALKEAKQTRAPIIKAQLPLSVVKKSIPR